MEKAIKKLSKEQLQAALLNVLQCHERHYKNAENGEILVSCFYQLAGNIISIRENYKLPPLK